MEKASEHLIIAEMLRLSSEFDEIRNDSYEKIPELNLKNLTEIQNLIRNKRSHIALSLKNLLDRYILNYNELARIPC